MRSRWYSFVTGALFGGATVAFYFFASSRSRAEPRAPAVTIDDVYPPERVELDAQPAPEVDTHHFPLESESFDVDPISQRW